MFDFRIRDQGKKKIFLLYGSSSRMGPIFDCLNLLMVVIITFILGSGPKIFI